MRGVLLGAGVFVAATAFLPERSKKKDMPTDAPGVTRPLDQESPQPSTPGEKPQLQRMPSIHLEEPIHFDSQGVSTRRSEHRSTEDAGQQKEIDALLNQVAGLNPVLGMNESEVSNLRAMESELDQLSLETERFNNADLSAALSEKWESLKKAQAAMPFVKNIYRAASLERLEAIKFRLDKFKSSLRTDYYAQLLDLIHRKEQELGAAEDNGSSQRAEFRIQNVVGALLNPETNVNQLTEQLQAARANGFTAGQLIGRVRAESRDLLTHDRQLALSGVDAFVDNFVTRGIALRFPAIIGGVAIPYNGIAAPMASFYSTIDGLLVTSAPAGLVTTDQIRQAHALKIAFERALTEKFELGLQAGIEVPSVILNADSVTFERELQGIADALLSLRVRFPQHLKQFYVSLPGGYGADARSFLNRFLGQNIHQALGKFNLRQTIKTLVGNLPHEVANGLDLVGTPDVSKFAAGPQLVHMDEYFENRSDIELIEGELLGKHIIFGMILAASLDESVLQGLIAFDEERDAFFMNEQAITILSLTLGMIEQEAQAEIAQAIAA
jgi:hypothetical protein